MRVLYDGIVFQNSYQRGIQRAFREMIDHMPEPPAGPEAVLALGDRAKCPLPRRASVKRTVPGIVGLMHRRMRKSLIPKLAPKGLKKAAEGCDVFHSTYYTLPPREMPTVLHVHDLIPERFPEMFPEDWAKAEIEARRKAIQQATRIITISRATADDVIRMFPEMSQKVTTVYFGCEHLQKTIPEGKASTHRAPDGERYALFVGERTRYKNFAVVFEAMKKDLWPGDVGLVVAGPPFTEEEQKIADELTPTLPVHHAERPSDAELAGLFANAMCVLVPSLAEGFGFPVLEGQAAGTHVVCSDIPVFREVAGKGAFFFDPRKPEELARSVAEAASPITQESREEAVWQNLRRFSWDKCSREVLSVYQAAMRS